MYIAFHVPSSPVAQPRQRHAVRTFGDKAVAVNYTPTKSPVNEFKALIKLAFREAYKGPPLSGAVNMKVTLVFPRPQNKVWKTREMPRYPHTKKPDIDNCLKSILDAIRDIAMADDGQVYSIEAHKYIASGDEQPSVYIELWNDDDERP